MARQPSLLRDLTPGDDPLAVILRAHQAMDAVLAVVISKSLPEPHALEVEQLAFPLKVDLAVALRAVDADSRGAFLYFNRLRNRFAHRRGVVLEQADADAVRNAMSARQRRIYDESVRPADDLLRRIWVAAAVLVTQLEYVVSQIEDGHLYAQVLHEYVQEKVGGYTPEQLAPFAKQRDADLHERFLRAKSRAESHPDDV